MFHHGGDHYDGAAAGSVRVDDLNVRERPIYETADLVGLLDHCGVDKAIFIGIDFGAFATFAMEDTVYQLMMTNGGRQNDLDWAEGILRQRMDAHAAGYQAVLVGETLVTSGDPAAAIADLIGR
mgnify:CR=1 FL=1